jgi:Protein of unknown function (DUF3038)
LSKQLKSLFWQSATQPVSVPPPQTTAAKPGAGERHLLPVPNPSLEAVTPEPAQLDNIKAQLDLVLLALESLTNIGSDAMLNAASELGLGDLAADRVSLWRLRQSNPLRRGSGGRKKLDVEEARALVMIICLLAKQHQSTVRQGVMVLEQMSNSVTPPSHHPLLGDYLDRFVTIYQERMAPDSLTSPGLEQLALKLLIDLLFYTDAAGPRRLWLALLDRANGAKQG